jgi:hypothetical protein
MPDGQYKVLCPTNVFAVAICYVTPDYQAWLHINGTFVHTLSPAVTFKTPTGVATQTFSYVYIGRNKNVSPNIFGLEYIWKYDPAMSATLRAWQPMPTTALDAYAASPFKYDIRLMNDKSFYTPSWINGMKNALGLSGPSPVSTVTQIPDSPLVTPDGPSIAPVESWFSMKWMFIVFVFFVILGFLVRYALASRGYSFG